MKIDLSDLGARWPSAMVFRREVRKFTGGAYSGRYLANLDSRGEGPRNRVRIGRRIGYRVGDLVEWLEERATALEN